MNSNTTSIIVLRSREPRSFRNDASRVSVAMIVLGLLGAGSLLSGCATKPVVAAPPPAPVALHFTVVGDEPIADRSSVAAQGAIEEANRVWAARSTDKAGYLRAARLLNGALEAGEFATSEEQVRLATMALQNALLGDDRDTMRIAARHWEHGFAGIRFAPTGGEVETYLLACRRLGQDLPPQLVSIAHPEIQTVLAARNP